MQTPPCRIRSGNNEARRVLVIEPDIELRAVMANSLRSRQYEVIETSSIVECLRLMSNDAFDLVVLDLDLSVQEGLGSFTFLRAETISRLLLVSAPCSTDDRLKAYEAGADFIIPKPFDVREFTAAVAGLMQRLAPRSIVTDEPKNSTSAR